MGLRKRFHLTITLMVAVLIILAGCGNQATTNQATTNQENTGSSDVEGNEEANNSGTSFPERQIELVVTHGAGGSVDTMARAIQPYLQKHLGVPVVVINREGAGGKIARQEIYNEEPTGYRLLVHISPSTHVGELIEGGEYKTLEFAHVYNWSGQDAFSLVVHENSAYDTFDQLLEQTKDEPILVGGAGNGTAAHLAALVLSEYGGLNLKYVPYGSGAEAAAALLGGEVDAIVTPGMNAIKQDEVKILVVLANERLLALPDIPTFKELGYEGIVPSLGGAFAPPGTPEEHIKILNDAFEKAVYDPEFIDWAAQADFGIEPLNSEEYYKVSEELYRLVEDFVDVMK